MKALLFAVSLLTLVGSAALAKEPRPEAKDGITAGNAAWMAAYAKGDAAALAALYTEGARLMPPGAEMVKGRADIQKFIEAVKAMGLTNVTLTTQEIIRTGHATALEIGTVSYEVPDAQKKLVKLDGKYAVSWRLVKGKWLLDTDIWNTNK